MLVSSFSQVAHLQAGPLLSEVCHLVRPEPKDEHVVLSHLQLLPSAGMAKRALVADPHE